MELFGVGLPELLVIGIIALLVVEPEKLPELMRQVGRALRQLQRLTTEAQTELQRAINVELAEAEMAERNRKAGTSSERWSGIVAPQSSRDGAAGVSLAERNGPADSSYPGPS